MNARAFWKSHFRVGLHEIIRKFLCFFISILCSQSSIDGGRMRANMEFTDFTEN